MEYKTVEFWEDILNQFLESDNDLLCSVSKFKNKIWGSFENKDWINVKACQFINSLKKENEPIIGIIYLFIKEYNFDKEIRIEFLQWLINDLKNEQECIDNLTSIG